MLKGNIISPSNEKYIFSPSYLLINMFVVGDFQKEEQSPSIWLKSTIQYREVVFPGSLC